MAAMLCELFGLALASGVLCSSPRPHVREMVCGVRANLDLPARRLLTERNEHKQSRREAEEEEEEEVYDFTPVTPTPRVLLSGTTLSGREHPRHTRLSDWAVLRCCGWHPGRLGRRNVKCCISLHALPSLVSGKDGNPIISHA